METRQLNSIASYPSSGLKANQLNTLQHIGMLSGGLRMSQRKSNFMPPIASKIPDQAGADLLAQWIDSLTACP